jgi:hypothetical protein
MEGPIDLTKMIGGKKYKNQQGDGWHPKPDDGVHNHIEQVAYKETQDRKLVLL